MVPISRRAHDALVAHWRDLGDEHAAEGPLLAPPSPAPARVRWPRPPTAAAATATEGCATWSLAPARLSVRTWSKPTQIYAPRQSICIPMRSGTLSALRAPRPACRSM